MIINPYAVQPSNTFNDTLPVTSGLVIRMKANSLGLADGANVTSWNDSSGNGNNPTISTGLGTGAKFKQLWANGFPAVLMGSVATANAGFAAWTRAALSPAISTAGTIFVVGQLNNQPQTNTNYVGMFGAGSAAAVQAIPWTDGKIYDDAFTNTRVGPVNVGVDMLKQRFLYTVQGQAGSWQDRLNGVQLQANASNTVALPVTMSLGRNTGSQYTDGYIAEFIVYNRYLTGTEIAQVEAFLNSKYSMPNDPSWASVISLMHFDGANGSTTFTDEKGIVWTATSPAAISTAQSKFGGASGLFTSGYIQAANTPDFAFPGMFTIEAQVYMTSTGSGSTVNNIFQVGGGSNHGGLAFGLLNNRPRLSAPFVANLVQGGNLNVPLNTWTHVAITRDASNVCRVFVGGALDATTATSPQNVTPANTSGSYMSIGGGQTDAQVLNFPGYIDELRITKGVCRYTAAFTPPMAPFASAA